MHHFQLGQYKDLKITSEKMFTEKELEAAVIETLLNMIYQWSKDSKTVEEGDEVAINVSAACNNLPVPELSTSNLKYRVGDPKMFAEFKNVIGHKKEDRFQMTIDFPPSIPLQQVAGKKVDFTATVQEVWPAKQIQINDEIARQLDPGITGVSALKAKIRQSITANRLQAIWENNVQALLNAIIQNASYEFDPDELAKTTQQVANETLRSDMIALNGKIKNTALIGQGDPYFYEDCSIFAKQQLLINSTFKELARLENIHISDQEIQHAKTQILKQMQGDKQMFAKVSPTEEVLQERLLEDKIINHLLQWNHII